MTLGDDTVQPEDWAKFILSCQHSVRRPEDHALAAAFLAALQEIARLRAEIQSSRKRHQIKSTKSESERAL